MTDWKSKLAAYLHDPPSKCLDIATHGERSDAAFRQAGFIDLEVGSYFNAADHTGAAADRLPFPTSSAAGLQCAFDGVRNTFRHPLSGQPLAFHAEFPSAALGFEGEGTVQPTLADQCLRDLPEDGDRWRARFFAHWRLWPNFAVEKDYRMALLPADTRIPDHSIWTHMQVVSALAGCTGPDKVFRPAFLKFQLGPVQEFIAAARSIRDLWSGSYLLSWLMAAGLKALSEKVGPDSVVFPNLRGQPLFDLHWKDEIWNKVSIGNSGKVWDSLPWKTSDLLTPNLPNVFLAVVPADRAADLGRHVEESIQAEWKQIATAVWNECAAKGLTKDETGITADVRKQRFDSQISRFLSVSWQATPWPENLEDAKELAEKFHPSMPIHKAHLRIQTVADMATKRMPIDHRDGRYYVGGNNGPKERLNNIGLAWSVILALNSWQLDAVRQTRAFTAATTGGWQTGAFNNKDVLTGKDEAVAGGSVWKDKTSKISGPWKSLFKHEDWLSAVTLVKRTWHLAYLGKAPWNLATGSESFPMPNTRSLAEHDPSGRDDDPNNEMQEETDSSEKYFAVLAFDGDEIGKWVSGEKTPPFCTQLADYTDHGGQQRFGALEYFKRISDPDAKGTLKDRFEGFLQSQRPLSPSYHLQFSEALSNFALFCARPIVEAHDGRLIYAGGDDVVALLPADAALACAEALRAAFTGHEVMGPDGQMLFRSPSPGFLSADDGRKDDNQRSIPFLVPGHKADASVGIAIAHFKSPLQDVVRASQFAEKRAKTNLGRSAVAVTLFKRSGETTEWGCKWVGGGLRLFRALAKALAEEQLSAKFPYRFAELLTPYRTQPTPLIVEMGSAQPVPSFNAADIIQQEFMHTLSRQRGPAFPAKLEAQNLFLGKLTEALRNYLTTLSTENSEVQLQSVIGLCQTVAFAHRTRSGKNIGSRKA